MTATLDVIDSYLALDSTQYAQVPIGATRVATKGNATLQGVFPAWSPAADFRIKCKFITTGAPSGSAYTILAGTGVNTKFFLFQGNGVLDRLTLRIEQSAVQYFVQSATTLLLDVVNEITIERISGATTMTLNGSLVNVPYTLDTFDVARVYQREGYGPFIGGCIWDLGLTDLTTPANSRFYPMDGDGSSSVITDTSANAQHGTWYNRTSSDVVTIYPYAVTMSETFTFAIKFRATGGSSDPRLFTIGNTQSGYSALSCILRTSTGVVDVVRSENGSITGTASVADLGSSPVDGRDHVLIIKKTSGTAITAYLDTLASATSASGTAWSKIMRFITLNGRNAATVDNVGESRIHYVYLYSGNLSDSDITALMQGANPETVGTIRQGYNLNGNGNEVSGGNALALYNAPSFVRRISIPTLVDSLTSRKLITSLIGSIVS